MRLLQLERPEGIRRVLVHRPAGIPDGVPLPLVIFLHGAGGSAEWCAEEVGWNALADARGFAVAWPEGRPVDPYRPAKFLTNPMVWNDGSAWYPPGMPRPDDVAFLASLPDRIAEICPLDRDRIVLTGFSNGASMTYRVAESTADRLLGIAPVAGLCRLDSPAPVEPIRTLAMIGSEDRLIPVLGGRVRNFWGRVEDKPPMRANFEHWLRSFGEPTALHPKEGNPTSTRWVAGGVEAELAIVAGLGHHWPGGRGGLGERLGGPIDSDIDGCAYIADWMGLTGDGE